MSVSLQDVSVSFDQGKDHRLLVLDGFNLAIGAKEFVTIIGPNGCGKSTVLNSIAGTVIPDAGTVTVSMEGREKPQIGYIWQDYRSMLLPWFNVAENIAFPLRIAGWNKHDRMNRVEELLHRIGDQIPAQKKTYLLSGGQQQLINLLRCFALKPDVLLLDEPFSALDQFNRWSMAFTLEKIWLHDPLPVAFISHEVDEAIMLASRIVLMGNRPSKIDQIIVNDLPRPRNVNMLFSERHISYRTKVIEFLSRQGAIRNPENQLVLQQ